MLLLWVLQKHNLDHSFGMDIGMLVLQLCSDC